jgi:5'-nucleotidase
MREAYGEDNVILANAGDTWGGATIASLSNGEYIAPIMNAVGYDVMTLGNDDIARGTEQALKVASMNDFATLSAGWVDEATGENLLDSYTTFTCGDVKVGVFGLTTDQIKPDSNHPTTSLDSAEVTESCIAALKAEGCDVIVAVTHIGYGESYEFGSITLADNYSDVDLVIDGHSHTELPEGYVGAGGALVAQTGQNGANIGVTKLYLKDGAVVGADTQLISKEEYTANYEPDAEVQALVDYYNELVDEQTSQVVGYTDEDLIGQREIVRTSETKLGDALTDAIRAYTGADVALYPSALVRTSLLQGDLTLNDYLAVFGSGADSYVVTSTGAQLKEMLTYGVNNYPEAFMAFPQVSGITFTIVTGGETNEIADLAWEDGTPIQDTDTFQLALDLLFVDNGGIYDLTGLVPVISGQTDMANVLIDYMNQPGYTTPNGSDRITVREAGSLSFSDVAESDWFYQPVMACATAGIVNGMGDGTFSPDAGVTRGQAAKMIVLATGAAAEADAISPFTDTAGNWAESYIIAAQANGLMTGMGDGTFDPNGTLTRAQLASLIVKVKGLTATDGAKAFPDVSETAWYASDVAKASAAGYVQGDDTGTYRPNDVVKRSEFAKVIASMFL